MRKLWVSRYTLILLLVLAFVPAALLVYLQYRTLVQTQTQVHEAMLGNLQQALIGARVEAENDFYRWPRSALLGFEIHDWLRYRDIARMRDVALSTRRICPQTSLLFGYLMHRGGQAEVFVFRPGEARRSMIYSKGDPAIPAIRELVAGISITNAHFYSAYADLEGRRQQAFFHIIDDDPIEPKEPVHRGLIGFYGFAAPARALAAEYFAPLLNKHLARVASSSDRRETTRALGGIFDGSGLQLSPEKPQLAGPFRVQEALGLQPDVLPGWTMRAGFGNSGLRDFDRREWMQTIGLVLLIAGALASAIIVLGLTTAREKQLSYAKTEFVATVSHELKTPLSLIRGFVETLQLNRLEAQSQREEYFGIIQTEILRLSNLIDRILEMSKIDVGIKQYQAEPVDVAQLIDDTLAHFASELERGEFTVERQIDPNLPPANIDPQAFSQALLNLLSNAVKYSGTDRRIEVAASRKGSFLEVRVRDHGIGIPKAEQKRIFDSFYRGNHTAGKTTGAGLGLALVRHFAKAHGGEVQVKSGPGMGSSFAILLPFGSAS